MTKADQNVRWRWRVSHIFWGAMTLFMMGWAFFLGLMAGQGAIGTPEQMDSLRGLTRNLPGMERLTPGEVALPPREEVRLREPELGFYDEVVRGPSSPSPAAPTKPTTPPAATTMTPGATPAAGAVATAPHGATPPAAPTARIGPPILGKPEPFRLETAPPIDLTTPPARPGPGAAPAPAPAATPATPQPQSFTPQPQPFRPAPGQVATAPRPNNNASTPATGAPARGRFTVQVASLQDEYQARELVNQLKAGGHTAYLVRAQMEGVSVRYRVRVGPYDDFDRAQGAASRIRLQQTLAAYVTKEE